MKLGKSFRYFLYCSCCLELLAWWRTMNNSCKAIYDGALGGLLFMKVCINNIKFSAIDYQQQQQQKGDKQNRKGVASSSVTEKAFPHAVTLWWLLACRLTFLRFFLVFFFFNKAIRKYVKFSGWRWWKAN